MLMQILMRGWLINFIFVELFCKKCYMNVLNIVYQGLRVNKIMIVVVLFLNFVIRDVL